MSASSQKKAAVSFALAMACAPVVASATVLFQENFDTGTAVTQAARFDIFSQDEAGGSDTSAIFRHDYNVNHWYTDINGNIVQRLIPLAPRSAVGAPKLGLKLEVNNVSDATTPNTAVINLYPKLSEYFGGALPGGDHKMTFDVWMNYNGPFEGGGGSTEHISAGIKQQGGGIGGGTPRVITNRSGLGMTVNGERGNAFDYRFYSGNTRVGGTDALEQEGGYVAQDMGPGQPGPADGRNTYYQAAFPFLNPADPNDIWHETPGSIGKHWQTVEIRHEDGIVYHYIQPAGAAAPVLISARTDESVTSGHAMVGYADFNNGTAAKDDPDGLDHTYGIVDNIVVETVTQTRPTWNVNNNGNWSDAGNWQNGVPNAKTATADFTNAISGSGKTITVDGNQTVRALIFDNAQPYTLNAGAGGKITLDSLTTGILGTIKVKSGSHTINAPVDTKRIVWTDVAAGSTLTMGGAITEIVDLDPATDAARYLKKTGAGTLNLNAANTWRGDTRIEGGTVNLGAAGAIPTTNARVTLSTGTTLNTNGHGFGASRLTVNAATITGAANITVEDHLFTTGTSAVAANINFAPTVGFTGHRELVAPGALTLSGALSGTAKLHQFSTGTGSITVSGASTFTQPLAVRGGTLIVAANAPAGAPGPLGNSTAPVEVGDSTVTSLGTVQAATTAALVGSPAFSAANNTLTWNATNAPQVNAIDGVTLADGNRILVKNQGTSSQNGVYVRTSSGNNQPTVWTRIAELNETSEFQYGTQVTVGGGTTNNGRKYYLFAGNTLNAGTHSWAQEIANAALLTGGPVNIGRDVVVLDTVQTGTSTLGGNTAHNSTFSGAVTLNRNTTLTAAAGGTVNFTGALNANGKTITKAGDGKVVVKNARTNTVNVTAGTLAVAPDRTANGTSVINSLTIATGAKFDLAENKLVTNNPVGTAGAVVGNTRVYDGLQGMVQKAKNGDAWDGNGLTSSVAATEGGLTTIGIANGAQAKGGIGATETALWGGQTITGSSILAMYTYAGDANLDGAITGDDYSAIDFGILFEGMDGYANGDFNYDGFVTGDDYSVIDLNILLQGAQIPTGGVAAASDLTGVTAVPEPSACGFALLAAAAAVTRRRRRTN